MPRLSLKDKLPRNFFDFITKYSAKEVLKQTIKVSTRGIYQFDFITKYRGGVFSKKSKNPCGIWSLSDDLFQIKNIYQMDKLEISTINKFL